MQAKRSKKLWAGTLSAGAVAVLGLTLQTTSAPADSDRQGPPSAKTIKMVFADGPPQFEGPQRVFAGQGLRILNQTEPQEIGPHTFSLVDEGALPTTNGENRRCSNLEFDTCEQVGEAHNVSRTFNVRRRSVDRGAPGWDKPFTSDTQGDTWFTDIKRESETRAVTAEPGTTLYYFCVIHPDTMRGSIRVVGAP